MDTLILTVERFATVYITRHAIKTRATVMRQMVYVRLDTKLTQRMENFVHSVRIFMHGMMYIYTLLYSHFSTYISSNLSSNCCLQIRILFLSHKLIIH